MRNLVKIFLFLWVSIPLLVHAETPAPVEVTGTVNQDATRIVFHTPSADAFQVSMAGNQLQIRMPSPLEVNFREMLKTLNKEVISASIGEGGRLINIKLRDPNVRLRKFRGPDFFGVDLIKKKPEEEEAKPASAPEKKEEKPKPEKPAPKVKAPEPKVKPKAKPVEPPKTESVKKAPTMPKAAVTEKKPEEPEVQLRTNSVSPEDATRVLGVQGDKVLVVPWDRLVSAAMYMRGDYLWVVFDRLTQVPLKNLPKKYVTAAEQIPDRQNTILKLTLSPEALKKPDYFWVRRELNDWVLYFGEPLADKSILITTPEETHNNEIKLVVRHAAEPLSMLDPVIGDSLFIVPVRDPGNRIMPGRRFVEFEALPTIQGIVLVRYSDVPRYNVTREGLTVSSGEKLLTAPVVKAEPKVEKPKEEVAAEAANAEAAADLKQEPESKTMFPFARANQPGQFMSIYFQDLKDLLAEPDATRSQIRMRMAEHFFLNEFYTESLGMLRDILVDDPEFAAVTGIKPMIAGDLFLMERYDQSLDAFANSIENKEHPEFAEEQKLWYWASAQMLQQQNLIPAKPREGFDVATTLRTYLPSYPLPLRRKLMMIYANQLVEEQRTGLARKLFSEIRSIHPTQAQTEMLDYLEARTYLIEKKNDVGLEKFETLLNNVSDRRVRALALLEDTRVRKETAAIALPEAIEKLEKGRFEWRGDGVEFTLLNRLGQYYIENKQYREGMRTWRTLVTQFSGTTESLKVASEMAKTFAVLFDTGGEAYQMPPLQALSLFFEFNELLPVGVQGDRISRLLADYLASVDLLENAAAILTHQVRFRSQGEDRALLAAKLMELHLANNRADLANEVMDAMAGEKIAESLKPRYQLLRAEILVSQNKYPEALKQLEGQDSPTARDLKLAIFWHQQQWEQVVDILAPEMQSRSIKPETLSASEEERVLRLAIGYSKLRRFDDIKWLKQAFGKRIKNPRVGDAFDFVTDSTTPVDHSALESSLEMDKFQSFMTKYRLPEPPPPPAPPAEPEEKADEKAATGEKPKEGDVTEKKEKPKEENKDKAKASEEKKEDASKAEEKPKEEKKE